MNENVHFDALIVVTPGDCQRLLKLYPRLVENFPYGQICFIGSKEVGEIALNDPVIGKNVKWVDENEIIPFNEVHACMGKKLEGMLGGEPLPRGITGWYYQQFLKMKYVDICNDDYYMVWDGDTVPCRRINMFSPETGQPYIDLKHEHHLEYFETMAKILPGFKKVIERSFISEHMLMRKDIMKNLISDIEKNDAIEGTYFWEKIINCIEPEKIYDSSFSEFETYGTYVALRHPSVYKLRDWHSFRLGGSFFDINTICDRDFEWLGKDFDAISFEKGQEPLEVNKHYFDNPEYQKKVSAKTLLQAAQMEYTDGYKEVWADDPEAKKANIKEGGYHSGKDKENKTIIVVVSFNGLFFMQANIDSIRQNLSPDSYKIVVVDNASTDGVAEWLEQQEDIILVRNKENVGFGPACNQGVKATVGTEYENWDVFLLNNDTRLVFDALYYLKQTLYSADDIGAVGSISNYAGNKQLVEVEFDKVEDYIAYGEKVNVPMENSSLERVRLCGFAMLVRRKLWDEIGGFDEDFVPGYYEDDALSMEILRRGYRLMVVRNSFIYHAGSESFIKIKKDYQQIIQRNYRLFVEKYGFDIMKYAYASGTVISHIPYSCDSRFSVLHYGCGLGSELKAIRSIFPNSECVGIETNTKVLEIAKATEQIFESLEIMEESLQSPKFNVLIVDKDVVENMPETEKGYLFGMLLPDPVVLVKNVEYENFPYEKIKMIVWGMDNDLLQGTMDVNLVKNIADHGVICSIYSKNNSENVFAKLKEIGADEYFVFNNISEELKPENLRDTITGTGLRYENVLYIDSDMIVQNKVSEACDGIYTANAEIIPYLTTYFARTKARDIQHKELDYYRLLEKKLNSMKEFESEEKFLGDSDIHIEINRNCLECLDDIYDIVSCGKQLSVGQKWAEKEVLSRFVSSGWNDSAYVCAKDKYGDYGAVGFYCYNRREKKAEYFVFSKRIKGMGIEQYVYSLLGCPSFENDILNEYDLSDNREISWISEDVEQEILIDKLKQNRPDVFFKGTKHLMRVEPFLSGGNLTYEYDWEFKDSKLFSDKYNVICLEVTAEYIERETDGSFDSLFESLDRIMDLVKGSPFIVLLLDKDTEEFNEAIEEFAEDSGRIVAINISEYEQLSDGDYYNIAGEICKYINKSL